MGMSHCKVCCLTWQFLAGPFKHCAPSLGASAAAAGRVGVKARASGGAAGSASAGAGEKSVLGLQERMKRLQAAQPKVSHSFTLSTDVDVRQHENLCPATCIVHSVFILPSWFHATSVMFTWQDTGPWLGIAIIILTLHSFKLCECWSRTDCLGPYIIWHLELCLYGNTLPVTCQL